MEDINLDILSIKLKDMNFFTFMQLFLEAREKDTSELYTKYVLLYDFNGKYLRNQRVMHIDKYFNEVVQESQTTNTIKILIALEKGREYDDFLRQVSNATYNSILKCFYIGKINFVKGNNVLMYRN